MLLAVHYPVMEHLESLERNQEARVARVSPSRWMVPVMLASLPRPAERYCEK